MINYEIFKEFKKEFDEEYCSGVFSDELDLLGYRDQVVDNWVCNSNSRLFGKVRTLTLKEIETDDEKISRGLGFLASLKSGEVLFVKGSDSFAYFGELMTRLSVEIGISGAVIDGLTRDTFYTQTVDFPVYAKGYTPRDIKGRGRVEETDIEVILENISVKPNDYIFADSDALVVIPQSIYKELMLKVNGACLEEKEIKNKISSGVSVKDILLNHKSF